MHALQNRPLRRRKLDIHFSILKDNPFDKDVNQGTLVIFNLNPSVSNNDLRRIFGAYGEVKEYSSEDEYEALLQCFIRAETLLTFADAEWTNPFAKAGGSKSNYDSDSDSDSTNAEDFLSVNSDFQDTDADDIQEECTQERAHTNQKYMDRNPQMRYCNHTHRFYRASRVTAPK